MKRYFYNARSLAALLLSLLLAISTGCNMDDPILTASPERGSESGIQENQDERNSTDNQENGGDEENQGLNNKEEGDEDKRVEEERPRATSISATSGAIKSTSSNYHLQLQVGPAAHPPATGETYTLEPPHKP